MTRLPSTLLITCMDFRFVPLTHAWMNQNGYQSDYNHVVYGGCALNLIHNRKPHWINTFYDHVTLSIKLHHITTIFLFHHQDCAAYKIHLNIENFEDPFKERHLHHTEMTQLKKDLLEKFPRLIIKCFFIESSGHVEEYHSETIEKIS